MFCLSSALVVRSETAYLIEMLTHTWWNSLGSHTWCSCNNGSHIFGCIVLEVTSVVTLGSHQL